MIAATARVRGMTIATRKERDFKNFASRIAAFSAPRGRYARSCSLLSLARLREPIRRHVFPTLPPSSGLPPRMSSVPREDMAGSNSIPNEFL
jgi:hypothetical protein